MVILFAGWGMDERPFARLQLPAGYRLRVVWDYTDLSLPASFYDEATTGELTEVIVIGWSFGVAAAEHFLGLPHPPSFSRHITATIAVNGTKRPCDDTYGIPRDIYEGTLSGLSEGSLRKFRRRMAGSSEAMARFEESAPRRTLDELRRELEMMSTRDEEHHTWDLAIVSREDRIIPPTAQLRAWGLPGAAYRVYEIDGAHLPDFGRLLQSLLHDKAKVQTRFRAAATTYDANASVQHEAEEHLLELHRTFAPEGPILEVGCGTGSATRRLARRHPVTAMDLSPDPGLAELEGVRVIAGDAEAEMPGIAGSGFASIFSASTVQWFNSLPAFLRRAADALGEGGVILISTYGPQTMQECLAPRGVLIPYPTEEEIRKMIPEGCTILHLETHTRTLTFATPHEALRHISLTGVNALGRETSTAAVRTILRYWPLDPDGRAPLTYQPIYLVIKKGI